MGLPRLPGPDEAVLFVHTEEGGRTGPTSRRDLATKVEAGALDVAAFVWMDGMAGWEAISGLDGLLENLGEKGASPRAPGESDDDYNDRLFGDLIRGSWDYLYEHAFAGHIDEVFLGAVITSALDNGLALIDLKSDGSHHYVRFENFEDKSRLMVRLTHLTGSLSVAKVLGQRASVVVGYAERIGNISKVMNAVRAEMQSGYIRTAEPGTITVDGDIKSGYVTVQVDMFWNLDDYVDASYAIDYGKLTGHIGACKHALRKYLRGRFA
jgi:hypothetical protein